METQASARTAAATAARTTPSAAHKYSRKVFVGGLPQDIDQKAIERAFGRFGALDVDWPHKSEQAADRPPRGYCFLLFAAERSVSTLLETCVRDDDGKYFCCVSSGSAYNTVVQVRPWLLADAECVRDAAAALDPRLSVFVGGVPQDLAKLFERLFGDVGYAGIDTDAQYSYPKGAARVTFASRESYIAAITERFVQIRLLDMDKRVEVEAFVLSDQRCEACGSAGNYFCASLSCLHYYCAPCWWQLHAEGSERELHKPLVRSGTDRPRPTQPPRAPPAAARLQ